MASYWPPPIFKSGIFHCRSGLRSQDLEPSISPKDPARTNEGKLPSSPVLSRLRAVHPLEGRENSPRPTFTRRCSFTKRYKLGPTWECATPGQYLSPMKSTISAADAVPRRPIASTAISHRVGIPSGRGAPVDASSTTLATSASTVFRPSIVPNI